MEKFNKGSPSHKDGLGSLQEGWLSAGHVLAFAEHNFEFQNMLNGAFCETTPANLCLGFGCVTNLVRTGCQIAALVLVSVSYGILIAAVIAFQATNHAYEKATLGANEAIYGYEYSQATYVNAQRHNNWSVKALKAIRSGMSGQHTEMKQQLQKRHKDIANHVGLDIADAQNALGKAIVDAQNQLGQGIVDAQNSLGTHIIDAQNANGELIVETSNYITKQHNKLSLWLYDSLSIMFEKIGGQPKPFIGPLEEDQSVVPVELVWPEDQPTILERLEQIQIAFSSDTLVKDNVHDIDGAQYPVFMSQVGKINDNVHPLSIKEKEDSMGKVDAVVSKVDAVKNEVGTVKGKVDAVVGKVDAAKENMNEVKRKVDAVEGKVDAVEGKVDAVEAKVSNVQTEIQEMKDMVSRLFELMGAKFSKE